MYALGKQDDRALFVYKEVQRFIKNTLDSLVVLDLNRNFDYIDNYYS